MIHSKPITLVLDLGSYRTLLGIAGEENPSLATYSYLTTDNTYRADDPYTKYSVFGKNNGVESQKPEDELESIFQNCNQFGQVDNYAYKKDTFEAFVETALAKNLEMSGETLSILIAEDVACDSHLIEKQREDIAEFFFETLQIDALTFMKKPMLSCFSVGRTSGLVLDSGHSFTRASLVEDGYTVYSKSIGFGGGTLHGEVGQLLNQKVPDWKFSGDIPQENFTQSLARFNRMLELQKIKHTFDTSDGMDENQMVPQDNQIQYSLPDGNKVTLNRSELVDPFTQFNNFFLKYLDLNEKSSKNKDSLLFPSFITENCLKNYVGYRSPAHMAVDALDEYLKRQEIAGKTMVQAGQQKNSVYNSKQARKQFLSNIIFTGGNFLFSDFATWTKEKISNLSDENIRTIISPVYSKNTNENSTSWIGGSIIAEMPSFSFFWTSRKQWNEEKNSSLDPMKVHIPGESYAPRKRNLGGLGLINKKCA